MLAWAFRYLALAVLVAIAFATLQGAVLQPQPAGVGAARVGADAPAIRRGGADSYAVRAGPNGHFVVHATVDGTPIEFMIDTGASDIVLSLADAERLGFRRHELRFDQRYQTANGIVRAAPVTLRELRLGQFSLYDLAASVNEAPLATSLLGMSFLRQLEGYDVAGDHLILRW